MLAMTRSWRTASLVVGALALGALSFLGGGTIGRLWKGPPPASTIRLARDPVPVPLFEVPALDGTSIASAGWRGRVTLVNFWATWCAPCRQEAADFQALLDRYPGRLRVVALSVDEDGPAAVRAWIAEQGVGYQVGMADADLQARFGGIEALPTTFVLDAEGRIVQRHVGLFPSLVYDLEVRALLDLPVDAIVERVDLRLGLGRSPAPAR